MKVGHVAKSASIGKWQAYADNGEVQAIFYADTRPAAVKAAVDHAGGAEAVLAYALAELEEVLTNG